MPFEGLQKLEYGYDPVGNILSIKDYNAGGTQTQSFVYDPLDCLTSTVASGGSGGLYSEAYTYDQIGNLKSKGGVSYNYGSSKPHAVTGVPTSTYTYDAGGNMVTRTVADGNYALSYDVEGRLVEVKKAGSPVASFGYDGDGQMVTATVGTATTVYLGNYYEKEGTTVRSYYYHGGQRIAMRENGTLYWLLTDHLGSTAVVANEGGAKVAERQYRAFGQSRYDSDPLLPTKYRFTGQREESAIGLYFYNARWYDPVLGRYAQADTLVPEPDNPQSLNRYSYVLNNPLRYTDPSGSAHEQTAGFAPWKWDPEWVERYKAAHGGAEPTRQDWRDYVFSLTHHGSGPSGSWNEEDWQVYEQLRAIIGADLMEQIGNKGGLGSGLYSLAGQVTLAGVDLEPVGEGSGAQKAITKRIPPGYAGWTMGNVIALNPSELDVRKLLQHEYLHVLQ